MSVTDTHKLMAANAHQASAFLKKLANEHRLMILCALVGREMSVGELNALVPLSQSALSQHLAGLRTAELVSTRRQGQTIFYAIANPAVQAVIQLLHDQFFPDGIAPAGEPQ
ncbi:MAG TPA: metalloregulator ArsR/SmtB family transcription factor [Pseudomonadales bacterium]|nr:metalloregulator ArsR/SmtB family transcription factor [Pseudomonadales bacterium]